MSQSSGNSTVAKNTIMLSIRMLVTMLVSLYTSRVVLKYLGVEDYGTYQTVGGVVGILSFLNNVLSTGSSRFITFELGGGDKDRLHRTFCTTLNIHVGMAGLVVVLAETIGVWFLYNRLGVPNDRIDAAFWVYQLSILTSVVNITQIPYNATIISHERMGVYAYLSIVDVSAKLLIVYLLCITSFDRLIVYATLLFFVQTGMALYGRYYCRKNFEEAYYDLQFDKSVFKEIIGFSGWTVITQVAIALTGQGAIILTNIFFGPAIVASRAIAIQVNMAANQFVNSFRTAVNPQVVKRYAAGDIEGSHKLVLQSTVFSFFLMYMLSLPIVFLAEPLLQLWLGQVPPYSVVFLQIIIVQSLFCVFDTSFYTALYAQGRLKENALLSPMFGFMSIGITYGLFKLGFSPLALSWSEFGKFAILGLIVKPILLNKIAKYSIKSVVSVYKPCLSVVVTTVPLVYIVDMFFSENTQLFVYFPATIICSVLIIGVSVWFVGIEKSVRSNLMALVWSKIRK